MTLWITTYSEIQVDDLGQTLRKHQGGSRGRAEVVLQLSVLATTIVDVSGAQVQSQVNDACWLQVVCRRLVAEVGMLVCDDSTMVAKLLCLEHLLFANQ